MWLEAIVTKEDLTQVLAEFLPVKIHLDNDDKTERWLWVGKATEIFFLPEEGLRVTCPAELCWSIVGMSPIVKFDTLGILLRPEIVEKNKGHALEFRFALEEADIRGLPALIDSTIVKAVNAALWAKPLTWNFTETLTRTVKLPEMFDEVEALKIEVGWGKKRLSADALVLVVSFKLGFVRTD